MAAGDLAQLIEDAARGTVAVDELLRRLKVIASRARIAELESWVQHELDGYGDDDDLPAYRGPFDALVLGHLSGPFQSQISNQPIPPSSFPQEYQTNLFQCRFGEGVAELESLAASSGELRIPWPADALILTQVLQQEGKSGLNGVLNEAHRVVSRSTIVGILRTVRDRVLSLALRLEQENPQLGESGAAAASASVGRDVNVIVNGGQPNIAVQSSAFTQNSTVHAGDRASLFGTLRDLGLAATDLNDLDDALDEDQGDDEQDTAAGPGRRVSAWLGKMLLAGAGSAGAASAQQVGTAVAHFFQ